MGFYTWPYICDIIAKIFIKEGQNMTERQYHIFKAIRDAYITARNVNYLGREQIEELYKTQMQKADEDELRRIEDIALLFFAAMFKFGEE